MPYILPFSLTFWVPLYYTTWRAVGNRFKDIFSRIFRYRKRDSPPPPPVCRRPPAYLRRLRLPRREIDQIIRCLDHIQIVLDHRHRIASLRKPVQDLHQFLHIRKMKSRGGSIQDINRFPVLFLLLSSVASLTLWASPPAQAPWKAVPVSDTKVPHHFERLNLSFIEGTVQKNSTASSTRMFSTS